MYPCSADFHTAVRNGNPQKALLIFSDCVFTNDDINVENGIQFNDYFNLEEDIAIGQTPSNEISFSLFNDDRLLNNYGFGDFIATLGVLVREDSYSQRGICMVVVGNDTYLTDSRSPYIRKNGTALGTQPNWQIRSMLAYDGKLYCFGETEADYIVYNLNTGSVVSTTINAFMRRKAYNFWNGKGMYYHDRTANGITIHELLIWKAGVKQTYEFVPLGHFTADRPKAPDKIQIDMVCNDLMMKFDKDYTDNKPSVTYPVTLSSLYAALCNSVGVSYRTPSPFINGTATLSEEPEDFDTASKRDVLKWIAEAACANARIDRDGYVILDWVRSTNQSYDATGYEEFEPYWYQTPSVSKLYNRDSNGSEDKTVGSGSQGYLILDNPILKGVS